ncbi:hydrogenase maturation nickel metallochaperone HypA/HybF [Stieleria varia]|uniref:Hydrogenase maturation factor HypA n=1 Tax=Stieleria varia TaxID=2528005 RepID=A0A5C5ZWA7_9BACT|nr:hydrogenase maturation nickel metallochaperone HypA [Stieleria varia]TWT91271.1 hydrogenase nickel incorporation protein [Stieleria varia]
MHETSLVRSLLRQVNDVLAQNGGIAAKEIVIEIGPLSGVEPDLVVSAFEQLVPGTRLADAVLNIQFTDLLVKCRQCDSVSEVQGFVFRCNACGCRHVQVISGDQVLLKTVTIVDSNVDECMDHRSDRDNDRKVASDCGLAAGAQHG